ncbi:hypothetical protein B0I37DRAFT_420105 [Chaetomium sp. MPI-CAGE-AT-0009]|nr:hypothetical protein B0I37DRAFT_420105 [Chaetomium sp. MPI-CAGE-AT-0009]
MHGLYEPFERLNRSPRIVQGAPSIDPQIDLPPVSELGEIPATLFPRALYETPSANRPGPSRRSTKSRDSGARGSRAASARDQGSPLGRAKGRLQQAQLRLRKEHNSRAGPRGPTRAAAGQISASMGRRGTDKTEASAILGWRPPVNSVIPARNGTGQSHHHSGVIAQLSRECQMRHFNLEWQSQALRGGKFTCNVKLRDFIVPGDEEYNCQQLAKEAAAHKALAVVQSWPIDRWSPAIAYGQRRELHPPSAPWIDRYVPTMKQEGPSSMGALGHGRATALTVVAPGDARVELQADLLDHMSKVMGIPVPISSRNNPEATQAFIEGIAVGTRLVGAGISGFSIRNRSRSPSSFRASSPTPYRARSPPPRENGRLNSSPQGGRPPQSPARSLVRGRGRLSPPSVHDRWVHDRYRDGSGPSRN